MKRLLTTLFATTLLLGFTQPARADISPPHNPSGSSIETSEEITQVRMMDEVVVVTVLAQDPPQAHVTANFTMRNLGKETESMFVRFPLAQSDGWGNFPEIRNFGVKVNDKTVSYERVLNDVEEFSGEPSVWATFSVFFMPEEDVHIKVSYDLDGTGYDYETDTSFYYTLSTGAGWKDAIGSAEIILRLPYEANLYNVILNGEMKETAQFSGNEVHWAYTDFEPAIQDNLIFDIVRPLIWKQAVDSKNAVTNNPQDGEAWGQLGKAYKESLFASPKGYPRVDEVAPEIYTLSKEAYQNAVTLLPKDGLWHAGYAELLLDYTGWGGNGSEGDKDWQRGFQELNLAYQLAPNEPKVQELCEIYATPLSNGKYDFPSLTQTPEASESIPTLESPEAPATEAPQVKATTSPGTPAPTEPKPVPRSPICGGTALIPLLLGGIWWLRKR
jgi:hypothetical protein